MKGRLTHGPGPCVILGSMRLPLRVVLVLVLAALPASAATGSGTAGEGGIPPPADAAATNPSDAPPPDAADDSFWSLRASWMLRFIRGTTQVREYNSRPAHLDLHKDLGLDTTSGVHLEALHDGSCARLLLEADFFSPDGRGSFATPFAYDEGSFAGGVPYRTTSQFFFLRGTAAFKLAHPFANAWLGPVVGFEYPYFSLGIDQTGVGNIKESYRQFVPYPVAGLAFAWQLHPRLLFEARATGTYVSAWPTPFIEGGRQHMYAHTLASQALLSYQITHHLAAHLGAQYQYWDGGLHSHEDGNELRLSSPGVLAGLEVRW